MRSPTVGPDRIILKEIIIRDSVSISESRSEATKDWAYLKKRKKRETESGSRSDLIGDLLHLHR